MQKEFDLMRPDLAMAEVVNALLRVSGRIGVRRAAKAMEAAGVPVSVIARVLWDTPLRRPANQVLPH